MTITKANLDQMVELLAAVKADGVGLVYQAGWDTRDAGGSFGPWVGIVDHHDASGAGTGVWGALGIIVNGRGGANPVPGPLAQFQIARGDKPQIAVVTAGRANHAGAGGPYGPVPVDSGNRWLLGGEKANDGLGEPYSPGSLYAAEVLFYHADRLAADPPLRPDVSVIGHKEYTPGRKADPAYDMTWMRTRVANHLTDDLPYSPDQLRGIAIGAISATFRLPEDT